jgi:sulfate permease, SulP family
MESFERQHPASNAGTTTTTPAATPAAGSTTTTSFVRYADAASAMERMRSSMIGSNLEFCPSKDILDQDDPKQSQQSQQSRIYSTRSGSSSSTTTATPTSTRMERLGRAAGQIPAILLIGMFHLMIGIPFGVSYFPIGWREEQQETYTANLAAAAEDNNHHQQSPSDDDLAHGTFPILAKEALGIRMFLFSTIVGQLVFTLASGFRNPIALQMVENVPFCHALAQRVIRHQGYGTEALSTLMLLFGLSSVLVGSVFMILGQFNLGRIVYYFPNHVLVGCIAGIGVFLAKTGMEVTMDAVVTELWDHMDLVGVVLFFEVLLRILTFVLRNKEGKQLYSLLTPIYFCLMTPAFYFGLWIFNVTTRQDTTNEDGYFFPSLLQQQQKDGAHSIIRSIFNSDLVSMWTTIDMRTISWPAIVDSIPTMVALTLFSLIHVPINIPAFALSTSEYTSHVCYGGCDWDVALLLCGWPTFW